MTDLEKALIANTAAMTQLSTSIVHLLRSMTEGAGAELSQGETPVGKSSAKMIPEDHYSVPKAENAASAPPAEPVKKAASEASAEEKPKASAPSPEPAAEEPKAVTLDDLKTLGAQLLTADPAPKGQKTWLKEILAEFLPDTEKRNLDVVKAVDYAPMATAMRLKLREHASA